MMIPVYGSIFGGEAWQTLAHLSAVITAWIAGRHATPLDPEQDVTLMVRHPIKWAIRHPVRAIKRAVR